MNEFYPKNIEEWYNWLEVNHQKEKEVWLVIHKKGSDMPTITYDEALNVALCFAWVDVLVKRIDDKKYYRVFKKKKENGLWSDKNKKIVEELITSGLMHQSGLDLVAIAKKKGYWDKTRDSDLTFDKNAELKFINLLKQNTTAFNYFNGLTKSHQYHYTHWISTAKKEETKNRRIQKAINMLSDNKKFTG
jgi:uncharacterized protein YdeI (YjbR/CyaY-like superfamily)